MYAIKDIPSPHPEGRWNIFYANYRKYQLFIENVFIFDVMLGYLENMEMTFDASE